MHPRPFARQRSRAHRPCMSHTQAKCRSLWPGSRVGGAPVRQLPAQQPGHSHTRASLSHRAESSDLLTMPAGPAAAEAAHRPRAPGMHLALPWLERLVLRAVQAVAERLRLTGRQAAQRRSHRPGPRPGAGGGLLARWPRPLAGASCHSRGRRGPAACGHTRAASSPVSRPSLLGCRVLCAGTVVWIAANRTPAPGLA